MLTNCELQWNSQFKNGKEKRHQFNGEFML